MLRMIFDNFWKRDFSIFEKILNEFDVKIIMSFN